MLIFHIILLSFCGVQSDTQFFQKILVSLKSGSSKELINHFAQNLALTIGKSDNYYTKYQAGVTLSDFFRTNKIISVKEIQRKISRSSNSYLVYMLKTSNTTYRVFIKMDEINKEFKISELRIE